MSAPVLTKNAKKKLKELKNVEECVFHPVAVPTNLPSVYAQYPLAQTSDRAKNRLAAFAVKLRESFRACLSGKDEWATSFYSELLLDTLLEDLGATKIKELDTWCVRSAVQEQVYSVSYEITTDDKFLQNMLRSVDALPARAGANLESINDGSAEFFKTRVLYCMQEAHFSPLVSDQRDLQRQGRCHWMIAV